MKEVTFLLRNKYGANHVTSEELKDVTDLSDALFILSDHWSFFDFELLRALIKSFCSKDVELIQEFNEYESNFKHYCERRLCEVPANSFNAGVSRKKRSHLHVKLDEVFNVKIKDVKRLNRKLSDMLQTNVRLLEIEDGCIELIYITLHESDKTFRLTGKQNEELIQMGVLNIYTKKEILSIEDIKEPKSGKYANNNLHCHECVQQVSSLLPLLEPLDQALCAQRNHPGLCIL